MSRSFLPSRQLKGDKFESTGSIGANSQSGLSIAWPSPYIQQLLSLYINRGMSNNSELSHWETLVFSFDMHNDPNHPDESQGHSDSVEDLQTAALLAQLAASSPNMFPPHNPYYNQTQPPPTGSGYNLQSNPRYTPANPYGSHPYSGFRGDTFRPPPPIEATGSRSRAQNTQAGPSTSHTAAMDADDDNDEYDDKRRRNTAASARFRIKKKQRTLDLERSVSDLTGRAEELEREASDLRRENGWLKEIVMLKGGRLAGINLSGNTGYSEPGGQSGGRRGKRRDSAEEQDESESDEQSGEDRGQSSGGKSKGKGKAASKKK
ncbi:hypothetical protein C8R46DRAFT_1088969 [Mycena filopes]|nr:hypothetical protein C8R46DRAFT_1088969 [Mycena filopes]